MAPKPNDNTPRGRLRALYDWMVTRVAPLPAGLPDPAPASPAELPARIGRYAVDRKLGAGGMGVVYAARDESLGRVVAVKTMSALAGDDTAVQRFWREARAAASVSHPNVCHVYEVGEHEGEPFIAMELLEGEPLAGRLSRGPLDLSEALPVMLGMLAALQALHARGIVHRDLKPSNVFLTPHGVKLLDFGLARSAGPAAGPAPADLSELTRSGMLLGTPRYMAPEQVTGHDVDARTDLFAAGAILFEMLAGRPAFSGRNAVEVLHATLHEQPPALAGSPAVAAADRVIHRALAKSPADRPASAEEMARELRAVGAGDESPVRVRALTRLVVLPFRILRPDPDTDFLAFSLPDAIATSLSATASLVVRSTAAAARFGGEAPDLEALAVEADVDRVVMGTLLRAGEELRASVQLVEAPGGTLVASHTVDASLGHLFRLQDDIARRVAEALSPPLGGRETPTPRAPKDDRAYELYLRANELARGYDGLAAACDLYRRAVELDPGFAPAWARLGRCLRVTAKYIGGDPGGPARAEEALRRALELDPRLTLAHRLYAQLEADTGQAERALVRLLGEATRHGNDAELFAGLVHACRYCGLFEQSLAAHAEARRLDPNVPTGFDQTLLMAGELERLLDVASPEDRVLALGLAGRKEEARRELERLPAVPGLPTHQSFKDYLQAWLEGRPADMVMDLSSLSMFQDPEAVFGEGWLLCDAGDYDRGLDSLQRAVSGGYFVAPTLARSRAFDAVRSRPDFQAVVAAAEKGRERALGAFREAGGERLLGA